MRRIYFSIIMVVSLFASCSEAEHSTTRADDLSSPITFGVDVDTRGLATNSDTTVDGVTLGIQSTGFGILGYDHGSASVNWSDSSESPDFMYNQEVSYNSGWSYSPIKYWSIEEADAYSFFAYAPYDASGADYGITLSDISSTGSPSLSFALNISAADMVDFVADQVLSATKPSNGEAVSFDLRHQLSRAFFSCKLSGVESSSASTTVVITGVEFLGSTANSSSKFYTSATYTFNTSSNDEYGFWSDGVAGESNYSFTELLASTNTDLSGYTTSGVRVDSTSDVSLFKDNEYLFLIPPTSSGIEALGDVRLLVTYEVVTSDSALASGYSSTDPITQTFSLPVNSLAQGSAYDYVLTFSLSEARFSSLDVTAVDWAYTSGEDDYKITQ